MIAVSALPRLAATCWLGLLGLSCSAEPGRPDASDAFLPALPAGGGSAGLGGNGAGGSINPLGAARCRPPAGMNGSPHTIEEAIALLNALPKPTSVACFVESLDRPLTAFATSSIFSAQPALSEKSPRVFIKIDRLWLSVVMDGDSSYLIEFSYLLPGDMRSIKGEVQAPFNEPLAPSAPYDRVRHGTGTICGICHFGEEPAPGVSFTQAFASTPFRPRPDTRVSLDTLLLEHQHCDSSAEPHRCGMLSAVFDAGPIAEEVFPDSMPTFF